MIQILGKCGVQWLLQYSHSQCLEAKQIEQWSKAHTHTSHTRVSGVKSGQGTGSKELVYINKNSLKFLKNVKMC